MPSASLKANSPLIFSTTEMPDDAPKKPFLEAQESDKVLDAALRPSALSEFTGQPRTVERIKIMTGAATARQEALRHILISGPPGLGKTTLAHIIANEMGAQLRLSSGPVIERPGDLAGLLTNLEPGDVLFIDEIHRLPKTVEEYLYSAMEDYCIDIMLDQGPNARSVRLDIPKFTLIGATTRLGLLSSPLRSRFTLQTRLDYYERSQLESIIARSCDLLRITINSDGTSEIARRCRGTPRVANNLIAFVRDYAQQRADGKVTKATASAALELLAIDQYGLDEMDLRYLRTMAENFGGGPVGLGTLSVAVAEEAQTIEEVHEPYLIQEGYIQRTPQGRVITPRGYAVLGLKSS